MSLVRDCGGCYTPIEGPSYNPGHNYGCNFTRADPCHDEYCSESCYSNAGEAAEQRAISDFHGGDGPRSIQEQCEQALAIKRVER